MECKHIQERLPAYREEHVDLEEKKAIEQHLSSCQPCSRALHDLKKTDELIKKLPEVEPPAWMTQKIMARVRAEEEKKKGLLQRLFYPLRIKIPIEVFATLLIAVAAVYVFKAVEPQMRPVGPSSAPEQGAAKNESAEPFPGVSTDVRAPASKLSVQRPTGPAEKKEATRSADERSRAVSEEKRVDTESKEAVSVAVADKAPYDELRSQPVSAGKREALPDRAERPGRTTPSPGQEILPPGQHPAGLSFRQQESVAEKDAPAGELRRSKSLAAPVPVGSAAMERRQSGITILVRDLGAASKEIQRLLGRLGAQRVVQESLQNAEVFTAELQAEKIKELFEALKPVGDVKEKSGHTDISQGEIARIRIEVISQP